MEPNNSPSSIVRSTFEETTNGQLGIPPEILSQIFEWCLLRPIHIPPDFDGAPWVLGRVCSHWRKVALNTPRLWREIEIDLQGLIDPLPRVRIGTLCAQRARNKSLVVENSARLMEGVITTTTRQYVNEFLIPFADRLSSLEFMGSAGAIEGLFRLPAGSLRNLEEISIYATNMSRSQRMMWAEDATVFQSCPLLKRVRIRSMFERVDPRMLHLPWQQITQLIFENVYMALESCHAILQQCSQNLHTLAIGLDATLGSSNNDAFVRTADKILLPNVSRLGVHFNYGYSPIFSILTLPRLTILTLNSGMEITAGWNARAYSDFITRSSCRLGELAVDVPQLDAQDFISLLRCSPTLIACALMCRGNLGPVFEKVGTGEVLPMVQEFSLLVDSSETPDQLCDALETRFGSSRADVTRRFQVTMVVMGILTSEHYKRIKELRQKGIDIMTGRYPR